MSTIYRTMPNDTGLTDNTTNPIYCLEAHPSHCEQHTPAMTEEEFINAASKFIGIVGAANYLKQVLSNLQKPLDKAIVTIVFNPYFCINISKDFCEEHRIFIAEDLFIRAGVKLIKKNGAKSYLKAFLQSLKGVPL
jgi:hypothetical protein